MSTLTLAHVTRRYGGFTAVDNVVLEVGDGEFVTLLGPSGCGKTTTLRMVAGFIAPDSGEIWFDDRRMTDVPPHRRNTAMVFQSYALFPHMSGGGERRLRPPDAESAGGRAGGRIDEALEMVSLRGLEKRRPGQLSGGQQQRVALARAIVTRPDILLFDEPLSNLDAKLREKVRLEIRELQRRLGITTLYVTHDQAEALAISDRIVVMNGGRIEQIGDPASIYRSPRSAFVADFLGAANIVEGQRLPTAWPRRPWAVSPLPARRRRMARRAELAARGHEARGDRLRQHPRRRPCAASCSAATSPSCWSKRPASRCARRSTATSPSPKATRVSFAVRPNRIRIVA